MYGQYIDFWWCSIPHIPPVRPTYFCWFTRAENIAISFLILLNFRKGWYSNYPVLYSDSSKSSKLGGTCRLFFFPPAVKIFIDLSTRP